MDNEHDRIEQALAALRNEAASGLERLANHHTKATELRAQADTEARAYASEYRALRARGFFSAAELRELGFTAPRTRTQRRKPKSAALTEDTTRRSSHDDQ